MGRISCPQDTSQAIYLPHHSVIKQSSTLNCALYSMHSVPLQMLCHSTTTCV